MFLDIDAIRKDAAVKIEKYDIRPPNPRLKTANFSGGNQQKIVLAREMERDPKVLIIGQPTRGVDVGAHRVHSQAHSSIIARRLARRCAWSRSKLDEIRASPDRVLGDV